MAAAPNGFTVRDTHGMLLRPEHEILMSSDDKGWDSL